MNKIKKEPKDFRSLWLKFLKFTPPIYGFGRLIIDVVRLFIER